MSLRRSTYRRFQIILADNGSTQPETARYLSGLRGRRRLRIISCPGPFNFSRLCNQGARRAQGDYLLFLNNDTEVLAPDWLEQMLAVARAPGVGVVGATLYYPDLTIQHAGVWQQSGRWTHAYRGRPYSYEGARGELRHIREVPAVTAACLLIRRELFEALNGFDESLPVLYNDVDLCLRVRARGLGVVITPHAQLLHYESLSRGYAVDTEAAQPAKVGRLWQNDVRDDGGRIL